MKGLFFNPAARKMNNTFSGFGGGRGGGGYRRKGGNSGGGGKDGNEYGERIM